MPLRASARSLLKAVATGGARRPQRVGGSSVGLVGILWTVAAVLAMVWLLGLILHIGGSLIHLLLVIAVIVAVYNLLTGRRAR